MTPDDLRARLEAAMRTAYALKQADRPEGLTASAVGGCHSYGARKVMRQPESATGDVWRALRGYFVHAGLFDLLAEVDPGFRDGRGERFTYTGRDGLPVTGELDFALDGTLVEAKCRNRTECRFHADHGASPGHAMQVSVAAVAEGYSEAYVVYLPMDGGLEEAAFCQVDVTHWHGEAQAWLERVDVRDDVAALGARGTPEREAVRRVLDGVDRDAPSLWWCQTLCCFAKDCRGDYVAPLSLEIPAPELRTAAHWAEHWRQVRLDAEKREAAAKEMLRHVEGVVTEGDVELWVRQQQVPAGKGRRAHVRTVVEKRQA